MNSFEIVNFVKTIQHAFEIIAFLQLTTYLWPQQAIVKDGDTYDFIIVGAGTAGSVIANRLTENENVKVLLIDAGGDPPLESTLPRTVHYLKRSRFDWNYTSASDSFAGKCHQTTHFEMTLGKMLGGSSSLNYMTYARGQPRDYNSWAAEVADNIWEWQNVLPYFKKAERLEIPEVLNSPEDSEVHGTNGYLGITSYHSDAMLSKYRNTFKELGDEEVVSLNEKHPLGFSKMMQTVAGEYRQSTAYAYLTPIKKRPNLHVVKNTHVNKILFDDNKNATGVEAVMSDGKIITPKISQEVIVSAGAINSPKLLLLSGIGPKEHLATHNIDSISDLPVGKNLQDHMAVIFIHKMEYIEDPSEPMDPHHYPASALMSYFAFNKTQGYPDYQTSNFEVDENLILYFCSFVYRLKFEICDELSKSTAGRRSLFSKVVRINNKSCGDVTLRSADPNDPPLINNGYFSNPEDIDEMVNYVEHFVSIINTTYFRSVNSELIVPSSLSCGHLPLGSRVFWHCYSTCMSSGMSHFSGSCPMGAVLDSKLHVKGVNKLRVADASIMPTITSADTYGPTVVIGEKAADIIKEEHGL